MSKLLKKSLIAGASLMMLTSVGAGTSNLASPIHARHVSYHMTRHLHKHHIRKHNINRTRVRHAKATTIKKHRHGKPAKDYSTYDLVRYAKKQIGHHYYTENMGTGKYTRNGMLHYPKNGWSDCAAFVYYVYRHCGYKVTPFKADHYGKGPNNAWAKEGSVVGPKRVRASQTVPGSFVQNKIHMVLLAEKYHGPKTRVIQEGGNIPGYAYAYKHNVNEDTLAHAFGPYAGHYRFYNPVKVVHTKVTNTTTTQSNN